MRVVAAQVSAIRGFESGTPAAPGRTVMFDLAPTIMFVALSWAWWWCAHNSLVRNNVASQATLVFSGST